MSEIDFPASMKPKIEAIAAQIQESYQLEVNCATEWTWAVLNTGKWLQAAKKIITPEAWPRWCAEQPNFSTRTIQRRIQFWRKYNALAEPEQASLLKSTDTIRGATKLLESDSKDETCDIPTTRVSLREEDITGSKQETALAGSEPARTPRDPDPGQPQKVTDSDPWQSVKREVLFVYRNIDRHLQALKDQIAIARGYPVFVFVSNVIEQEIDNLAATVNLAKPTAECPTCRAQTPEQAKSCRTCHSIGLVPKHYAERGR